MGYLGESVTESVARVIPALSLGRWWADRHVWSEREPRERDRAGSAEEPA
jgi:hypothetical protein